MKIHENRWKSKKIHKNRWASTENNENPRKITSWLPRFRKKMARKKLGLHFSISAKNITSQKYRQIVPTPCGSILQHTKPSQRPYKTKNRFLLSKRPYLSQQELLPWGTPGNYSCETATGISPTWPPASGNADCTTFDTYLSYKKKRVYHFSIRFLFTPPEAQVKKQR